MYLLSKARRRLEASQDVRGRAKFYASCFGVAKNSSAGSSGLLSLIDDGRPDWTDLMFCRQLGERGVVSINNKGPGLLDPEAQMIQ